MTAPALTRVDHFEQLAALQLAVYHLGYTLTRDRDTGVYWLGWRNFSQPCPTLADAEAALQPGSAWRALVERVKAR